MTRRSLWSRNLENEAAKARYRPVKIQPQGCNSKKTNKKTNKHIVQERLINWDVVNLFKRSLQSVRENYILRSTLAWNKRNPEFNVPSKDICFVSIDATSLNVLRDKNRKKLFSVFCSENVQLLPLFSCKFLAHRTWSRFVSVCTGNVLYNLIISSQYIRLRYFCLTIIHLHWCTTNTKSWRSTLYLVTGKETDLTLFENSWRLYWKNDILEFLFNFIL